MNQAPEGAQQAPTEDLGPFSTPLGGLMDRATALQLLEDPLLWYLQYWLNLNIIGIMRGEDELLLALRIEMEQDKYPEPLFRLQIQNNWYRFLQDNRLTCIRGWAALMGDLSEEANPYHRDLDRMLVDKGRKTRAHLRRMEMEMNNALRAADVERARLIFEVILGYYKRLQQEEAADAATRHGLQTAVQDRGR